MRKAFTLVELLVVVVVIVTLMAITFRLGSVGSESTSKARTVNRMQRLENCLSGYYAAYGSYPPVALHGSRDYTYTVDGHGIQQVGTGSGSGTHEQDLDWARVEAACRCQPVGMSYPFANQNIAQYVEEVARQLMEKANSSEARYKAFQNNEALKYGFFALTDNSQIQQKGQYSEWSRVQVFKFGLMSYLLPRMLVMLNVSSGSGASSGFSQLFRQQKQWYMNNELPCDFETGQQYDDWNAVLNDMQRDRWKVAALPSQATCARWMPNLEGIVFGAGNRELYGVKLGDTYYGSTIVTADTVDPTLYSAAESQSGGSNYSQQYLLDGMTVLDGWGHEFYYYSPSPHQSYTLWSAGANGKTFPPWVTDEEMSQLSGTDRAKAQSWIADDIVHMQN
ncbi:MAG: type II secretion system protein GspG [Kiritimatiellae bacterium]|nr:type II secretion system protein GspG [Kiritimatiellia bacterium]MBQ3344039.1 type II secretion system protein GspG [Kiritimatiellia bacterium]MBQ6328209.1 type II secretion system protein GspG [Kiritimatiellia bacterium]